MSSKPGQPLFSKMQALQMACQQMGLVIEKRKNYTWYNTPVGDYPLPEGTTVDQLGNNAEYVVSLGDEMRAKHCRGTSKPYELGLIADPNNPGCLIPMYDFWAGGHGLDAVIGSPIFGRSQEDVQMLAPLLKQRYDMCCEVLAARSVGDRIEILTAKQAHEKYPQFCPFSSDEKTFVSIADTGDRV